MSIIAKRIIAAMTAAPLVVALSLSARAQQSNAAPLTPQGPIDIQAQEQEFAGPEVIAKGDVHVKYKDSLVIAPQARLIRDAGGNPQKAIFTGHPRLIQGNNKIDAETLIFEVQSSHVIADGHAHSEVINSPPPDKNKGDSAGGGNKKSDGNGGAAAKADNASASGDSTAATAKTSSPAEDKIVTDSDHQEYDRTTGKFLAQGHVHVIHGDMMVKADKLQLIYGVDNRPETALFSGNVAATQFKNTTLADNIVYSLSSHRLQATGHVKSTVIQETKPTPAKKKNTVGFDGDLMQSANASEPEEAPKEDKIIVTSETQDWSRDPNRMTANGAVRVYYQDMICAGPACVMIRNSMNKPERIVFSGRSQVSQPTKRWIADHIEMTVADKKIIATGNTKAVILQAPKSAPAPTSGGQLAGKGETTK
ncbi:MAG TPA: LptA/OstA family protein [Candidatus Obscuribacterales bacterium]